MISRAESLKTLLVTLACLAGASYCGRLLYLDLTGGGSRHQGTALAKIERRESKVRRKDASSFVWQNIGANDSLFKKDSLQTSENSAAAVRFNDGTLLEVGENSLVVIDDVANLALGFKSGSIVVRSKTGDSRITVGNDGKAKVEKLSVRLIAPESLAAYYVPEKTTKSVRFEWDPLAKSEAALPDKFTVQVSPDKIFSPARTQAFETPDGKATTLVAPLAPGHYFWRLLGRKAEVLTETSQFRVLAASPLKPIFPNAAQKIQVWGEASPVQFRWIAPAEDSSEARMEHRVEVARDAEFKSIVLSEKIAAATGLATLKGIPTGGYFWRIQSRYPELTVASSGERFSIEKADKIAIRLARPEAKIAAEIQPQLPFAWVAEAPENAEFELQVDVNARDGRHVVSYKKEGIKGYLWKAPEEGVFRWRVVARMDNAVVGEAPWQTFSLYKGKPIALKTPVKDQEIYYWEEPARFAFSWTPDKLAVEKNYPYVLEVAKDAEFKEVVASQKVHELEVPSQALRLTGGNYFWRVKVSDPGGADVKVSEVARFAYGTHPPLRAPASSKPESGAVYNPLETESNLALSWEAVEGAESYELSVTDPVAKKTVYHAVTRKPAAEIAPQALEPGKYLWTVEPIDRLKRKGQALPPRALEVSLGAPLGAPESTTEEVQ